MKYTLLPQTDVRVSKICLGTMTWGEQNTEKEAFEQMDYAVSQGINFFDTAELYAVPQSEETQGSTESIIGNWLHQNGHRENIVLASKAAGPGPKHIRNSPNFTPEHLKEALHKSLDRLKTDYIDLYQLHWPERHTPRFGGSLYSHRPQVEFEPFESVLETLNGFIKEGKIRYIGISNETPWGMMKWLEAAQQHALPKIITIQNPYSLINRVYEYGNSEIGLRENIGLLAYSPLGGGILSGKYLKGQKPQGSRYALFPNYFGRYQHPNTVKATEAYAELAEKQGLSLSQMSLAFIHQKDFVCSNIIGATQMSQLKENIESINITLSDDILNAIDAIHFQYPNPAP